MITGSRRTHSAARAGNRSYLPSADRKLIPMLCPSAKPTRTAPPLAGFSPAQLAAIEPSLEPQYLALLTTGATGAGATSGPDPRIVNGSSLPNGPFQLTGPHLPYDAYTGDTTHRFYQMWQQSDCSIANVSRPNPVGCLNDLYPFVMTTFAGPAADRGGGTSMAFFNMQAG